MKTSHQDVSHSPARQEQGKLATVGRATIPSPANIRHHAVPPLDNTSVPPPVLHVRSITFHVAQTLALEENVDRPPADNFGPYLQSDFRGEYVEQRRLLLIVGQDRGSRRIRGPWGDGVRARRRLRWVLYCNPFFPILIIVWSLPSTGLLVLSVGPRGKPREERIQQRHVSWCFVLEIWRQQKCGDSCCGSRLHKQPSSWQSQAFQSEFLKRRGESGLASIMIDEKARWYFWGVALESEWKYALPLANAILEVFGAEDGWDVWREKALK